MTSSPRRALYSPELLALAVELADYPFEAKAPGQGRARSRTCGSTIELSHHGEGGLAGTGLRVSACAVGQAAAAIFAGNAEGQTADDLRVAVDKLSNWLSGIGIKPDWPRIAALEPALPHHGRHEAILLPWRAALDALSNANTDG